MNGERKEKGERRKGDVAHGAKFFFPLSSFLFSLLLTSCGFHLRGAEGTRLPPGFSVLRVQVQGSRVEYDPLLLAVQNALRSQAGVTVQDTGAVPLLSLYNERYTTRVLSVSSTVKAAEYMLLYQVSFRVTAADGKELAPAETVNVERDYSYDPLNVLAKEREDQELRQALRQDAVQQILRRLSRLSVPAN